MLHILSFFSIASLCFVCSRAAEVDLFYTRVKIGGKVEVIKGTAGGNNDWVAKGFFESKVNVTGFGVLEVETNDKSDSLLQAYHAGFLEGFLTSDLIYARWTNTVNALCKKQPTVDCGLILSYVKRNSRWVSKQLKKFANTDQFWFQVKLFYLQLNGLLSGYNSNTKFEKLEWDDILALNIIEELGDVLRMNGLPKSPYLDNDHCSALVKIMPGNSDIYFGHNTWNDYADMLRILKKYKLHYQVGASESGTTIPGCQLSASSYPGAVLSIDDYYLIGSGLAVMETTNEVFNQSLFSQSQPQGIVWEGVRTMVANRLASDGQSWHQIFQKYNSGTYNNQWMVLDYNRFHPGQKLGAGVLWVGEQLPGFYTAKDVTDILVSKGYWSSYNIPYFKDVYEMSGYGEALKQNGTWFSYTEAPRPKIFARDQGSVTDMQGFMTLMRSNNFQHDPFAFCNCTPPYSAAGAIAARKDLNPADGKGSQVRKAYGAIDAKITNHSLFKMLQFTAVAGPSRGTNDQLPVFKWSQSPFATTVRHMLQPDVFNFSPVTVLWRLAEETNRIPQVLNERVIDELASPKNWYVVDDNAIPIE